MPPFSHWDKDRRAGRELADHLAAVSEAAARFARHYPSAVVPAQCGAAHDLGKLKPGFGAYLAGEGPRTPHSAVGAIHAVRRLGRAGLMHAYVIAGHHSGLTDYGPSTVGGKALSLRLGDPEEARFLDGLDQASLPQLDLAGLRLPNDPSFSVAFYIRMAFSAMVDADWLDAEGFGSGWKSRARGYGVGLAELKERLDGHLRRKAAEPPRGSPVLHGLRQQLLARCRGLAAGAPGLWSLTAPTGFGKTLSGMAFCLEHAIAHGLDRVIYVAPYISITDQTADVFREVFGADAVVEHHSGTAEGADLKARLASENWDAPIVVTTAVQLFESLFASAPGKCRKLHNVAGSVVYLDEAQAVPADCAAPIAHAIDQLTRWYRTSVVLATATQPGIDRLFPAMALCREIVEDPDALHRAVRRVRVAWPEGWRASTLDQVAETAAGHPQCLVIVDDRKSAKALHGLLKERVAGGDGVFHLSTHQCPEHRRAILREVRQRLRDGLPVRLVSTRLIEAGVDVDFPVVMRSLAGIDAVIQAAGRCNREGRDEEGLVLVFVPADTSRSRHVLPLANATREVVEAFPEDAFCPAAIRRFFDLAWWLRGAETDGHRVLPMLGIAGPSDTGGRADVLKRSRTHLEMRFEFASAAQAFRMIDDAEARIVTTWGGGADVVRRLDAAETPDVGLLRQAARFSCSVPARWLDALEADGAIRQTGSGEWVQADPAAYDPETGWATAGG